MKRKVVTLLIILVCFLLESTVFQTLSFASVCPNLLIIVTSAFGFMRGQKEGMFIGFTAGLLADVFWGSTIGFNMLLYTAVGYFNGAFQRLFYDEDIQLPLCLIGASELFHGLVSCFCIYVLRGDFAFGTYLIRIIIPELVYTILVTLILYRIILHINRKLESEEQRSASKFV